MSTLKPTCWVCEAKFTRRYPYQRACSLICDLELNYVQGILRGIWGKAL